MTRNSIRYKIIVSSLLVTFVVLCVCGICSSAFFLNIMKKQVLLDERQKLSQSSAQIASTQAEMVNLASLIAADNVIQKEILREDDKDIFDYLLGKKEINDIVSRYLNLRKDNFSVTIVTDKEVYYSSGLDMGEDIKASSWYLDVKKTGESKGFSGVHEIYRAQNKGRVKVISYVAGFYDLESGNRQLGDIIIHVNSSEIIKEIHYDESILKNLIMTDSFGQVLWCGGNYTEETGAINARQNQNIIESDTAMLGGWNLTAEISNVGLLLKLKYIILFFIFLFLAALLVLGAVLWNIALKVLQPIEILANAAKEVGKGRLDLKVHIETEDEFKELADAFNRMVKDIQNYINDSVEYEKTAKEMEINRLMLQINPHFIYNTLNSIVYMAQIKGEEDIVIFTKAFISLLHDTLNVESEGMFISLKQEIKNVKNYLVLQSFRYPKKFEVLYKIDEECMDARVPNVLIQPLVENAVFHGICGKSGTGVLKLYVSKKDKSHIIICVEDDGAGMPREKARHLLELNEKVSGEMRKIGIANIKERIRYIYGEGFGMEIESQEGVGTKIWIEIPYQPKHD